MLSKKVRHVPPFPFHSPVRISDSILLMKNEDNRSLDFYSVKLMKKFFKVEKSGDFGLRAFEYKSGMMVYGDCQRTHVLSFDDQSLQIVPQTQQVLDALK